MTPPIPDWIRNHRQPGYRNIYELIPDETRIYGTESMYGDWNAPILLLAKDFACSRLVQDRVVNGDNRPYRHEPTLRTNKSLTKLATPFTRAADSSTCGLLYGSALACLLREDNCMSGSLPSRSTALKFGSRVLGFVIENMPSLEVIMCLGEEGWDCANMTLGVRTCWKSQRDSGNPLRVENLALIAAYHPAARVSREKLERPWTVLERQLQLREAA